MSNLTEGQSYVFRVSAENEFGVGEASFESDPIVCEPEGGRQPPKITTPLVSQTLVEHSKLVLKVEFTGRPRPRATWFRNGMPMADVKLRYIETAETHSTMTVISMGLDDAGDYKVRPATASPTLELTRLRRRW